MENKYLKSAGDIIALIFSLLGLFYTITGLAVFLSTLHSNSFDLNDSNLLVSLIFTILGLIFLLVGIIFIVRFFKRRSMIAYLKENGKEIMADVVNVNRNYNVRTGNGSPLTILCSATINGKKYIFKSYFLKAFPNFTPGLKVPVYYDPDNIKHYYVNCNNIFGDNVVFL